MLRKFYGGLRKVLIPCGGADGIIDTLGGSTTYRIP
jgi:hypothetical protein